MRKDTLSLAHYLYLLLMQFVLAAIQTAALALQFFAGEIPCPLCLLQRVAMFGVSFALIRDFREGVSARNAGIGMIFSLFLLIVSTRQTLLNIYPRPGHAWVGSTVFGLHMPVWSVVIATALLGAYALKFVLFDSEPAPLKKFPALARAANLLSLFVVALCAVNFVSAVLQCGLSACHTYEYRLLR